MGLFSTTSSLHTVHGLATGCCSGISGSIVWRVCSFWVGATLESQHPNAFCGGFCSLLCLGSALTSSYWGYFKVSLSVLGSIFLIVIFLCTLSSSLFFNLLSLSGCRLLIGGRGCYLTSLFSDSLTTVLVVSMFCALRISSSGSSALFSLSCWMPSIVDYYTLIFLTFRFFGKFGGDSW